MALQSTIDRDAKQAVTCLREKHELSIDGFARLPSVKRAVDGDVWCHTCREPVRLFWNGGHPDTKER